MILVSNLSMYNLCHIIYFLGRMLQKYKLNSIQNDIDNINDICSHYCDYLSHCTLQNCYIRPAPNTKESFEDDNIVPCRT